MGIHADLKRNRGRRFCPEMKSWCTKGWTPEMGTGPDGFPLEGACAAWQPVEIFEKGQHETLYDCTAYGWPADLNTEIAKEVAQGAASTDKVANQVYRSRAEFISALDPDVQARLPGPPLMIEHLNGDENAHQ